MLQLEDDNPPMAAPFGPPDQTVMGMHFAEIMRELNAQNDEVASLYAQRNERDTIIENAEVHVRSAEQALHLESQQRDVVISMAREVASGQSAVLHQMEQRTNDHIVEQAAQADRATVLYANAEQQIFSLENFGERD